MSIEHTLTNDWDLKLLTREEMLKDTTNRLYQVYKRMPADVQINGIQYMPSALPSIAVVNWKVKS